MLKPTDLVTFVGILTKEPCVPSTQFGKHVLTRPCRLNTESDTPAEVPTLHVLFSRLHGPSLVLRSYPSPAAVQIRNELVNWIASEALGGDIDAAEWVLLTSIARV